MTCINQGVISLEKLFAVLLQTLGPGGDGDVLGGVVGDDLQGVVDLPQPEDLVVTHPVHAVGGGAGTPEIK